MRYISTRGNSEPREFKEILLEGLAPDGGLYVPEEYPKFTDAELDDLRGKTYQETALNILRTFITDIPERICVGLSHAHTRKKFSEQMQSLRSSILKKGFRFCNSRTARHWRLKMCPCSCLAI